MDTAAARPPRSRARWWTMTCSARCRNRCRTWLTRGVRNMTRRQLWLRFIAHLDLPLLLGIGLLMLVSLLVLFSADNAGWGRPLNQLLNIVVAFTFMWLIANLPLHYLMRTAVPIYVLGMVLLIAVALFGEISHG